MILLAYLSDSSFFEKTERTDWANLDAYKDKLGQRTQIVNQHPFDVEYVQNIAQQACASLDYAMQHYFAIMKSSSDRKDTQATMMILCDQGQDMFNQLTKPQ
ncbi:hypothetical protein CQW23_01779 [Capsicum baccatum]|uniref:Uncharacterized protein n=1 Tax=Capsicum baccatum TaxID=33114 RepID=A0A2G2XPJ2_CAPBA|nr:hypothetical protein CQW23_01779 [Capsicum baccatum]